MPRIVLALCVTLIFTLAFTGFATAQDPPQPVLKVISPPGNEQAMGVVDVRIMALNCSPNAVVLGLPGAVWASLTELEDEPGVWTGTIDTTLLPNGRLLLSAFSDNRKARGGVSIHVDNPLYIYFGDLHSHTSFSDGTLIPSIAFDYARNTTGLDVFVLSDHLESVSDEEWHETRLQSQAANEDGVFTTLPGLEWTKGVGHMNIFDPKIRTWPEGLEDMYAAAAEANVVLQFNHPGDGTSSHAGLAYSEIGDKAVQLMETRRPQEELAFIRALNNGWHIAPTGTDDTHSANWGQGLAVTGLLMPGLSQINLLDALRNRRCYSTNDKNCEMTFDINRQIMGGSIDPTAETLSIQVALYDPDEADRIVKIELFQDGEIVETVEPNVRQYIWELERPSPGSGYVFVKATQADGHLLYSAPVWIEATPGGNSLLPTTIKMP
jgi:hypothetical protein